MVKCAEISISKCFYKSIWHLSVRRVYPFHQQYCEFILRRGFYCCCWQVLSCVCLFVTPGDCSLPGSSVHWILQARILEWVAIPFSRGIFPTQGSTQVSCLCWTGRLILYHERHLGIYPEKILLGERIKTFLHENGFWSINLHVTKWEW